MLILKADSYEAKRIAEADPFIREGYGSYELRPGSSPAKRTTTWAWDEKRPLGEDPGSVLHEAFAAVQDVAISAG